MVAQSNVHFAFSNGPAMMREGVGPAIAAAPGMARTPGAARTLHSTTKGAVVPARHTGGVTDHDDATDPSADLRRRLPPGESVSCGPGWTTLLAELEAELAQLDPDVAVSQVTEKLGGLRFYAHSDRLSGNDDAFYTAIRDAERRSARTCEECSAPGSLHRHKRGWPRTLCSACAASAGGFTREAAR